MVSEDGGETDWAKYRIAELRGASQAYQAKRKKKSKELFVKIPLWLAVEAAKAAQMPGMLVFVEMLHRSWKARSQAFPLPNGSLQKWGVSREVKRRVLRDLEAAGLIIVERRPRKAPLVTFVAL